MGATWPSVRARGKPSTAAERVGHRGRAAPVRSMTAAGVSLSLHRANAPSDDRGQHAMSQMRCPQAFRTNRGYTNTASDGPSAGTNRSAGLQGSGRRSSSGVYAAPGSEAIALVGDVARSAGS
jgi:hypothetical protein